MKPDAEFEMVSRICTRARWSTSGEHAKAVREVLREARDAGIEEAPAVARKLRNEAMQPRMSYSEFSVVEMTERIAESIRALKGTR